MNCQPVELKHVAPTMEEEWEGELAVLVMGLQEGLRKTMPKCSDAVFDYEVHVTSTFKSVLRVYLTYHSPCVSRISLHQSIEWHSVYVMSRVNIADGVTPRM